MAKKIMEDLYDSRESFLKKYKRIKVGESGWLTLIWLEILTTALGNLPGALGLALRSKLYRPFFKSIGKNVIIGHGVTLRNPGSISLGDNVVLDDCCVLDAKDDTEGDSIRLGSKVFVSRNALLGCKDGQIHVGDNVSFGPNSIVHSIGKECRVKIGSDVAIAANCYIVGAPGYKTLRCATPMNRQGFVEGKGVTIGDDVWIGASAIVMDGSCINDGAVIGAQSLVRGSIPAYKIAFGTPATIRGEREG